MNWIEIIRLFVILWPMIEKFIDSLDDEKEKEKAKTTAPVALLAALSEINRTA